MHARHEDMRARCEAVQAQRDGLQARCARSQAERDELQTACDHQQAEATSLAAMLDGSAAELAAERRARAALAGGAHEAQQQSASLQRAARCSLVCRAIEQRSGRARACNKWPPYPPGPVACSLWPAASVPQVCRAQPWTGQPSQAVL